MGKFLKLLGWKNLNWDWASRQMFMYFFQRFHPRFAINSRKNFHSWIIHHRTNKPSSSESVFKTPWSVTLVMRLQDVFSTFSRRLDKSKITKRHFQDVSSSQTFLVKTFSSGRIQHVFETYCQDDYLQRDLLWSHFWEIYVHGTKFPRVNFLGTPKLLRILTGKKHRQLIFQRLRKVRIWEFGSLVD